MKTYLTIVLLFAGLLVAGCSDSAKSDAQAKAPASGTTAVAAFNAKCPVSGDAVDTAIAMATFKGHSIGFCCEKCPPAFAAMSDTEKLAALTKHGCTIPE